MQRVDPTVLIVEDNDALRRLLETILTTVGYRTATAQNGREALDYLRRHPAPDLILLDLHMPEMCGRSFRRAQIQDPAAREIPVVIISSDADAREFAEQTGAAGCLRKPFEIEQILGLCAALCAPVHEREAARSAAAPTSLAA
jgi:CheY-like chemotaxis protein